MKSKDINKKIAFIYTLLINTFINYLLLRLFLDSLDVESSLIVFLVIIFSSLLSIIIWNIIFKRPILLVFIIFIIFLLAIYMNNFQRELYVNILNIIEDFIIWAGRFLRDLTFIHQNYFYILIVLLAFLLSLIMYIFVFRVRTIFPLVIFGTSVFLYNWFLFLDKALVYYVFYIILVLQLHSYRIYKNKEKDWNIRNKLIKSDVFRRWIVYSAVVAVIIVSIAAVLPKNFEPVTWSWLDEKMQERFPELTNWRNTRKNSGGYGNTMVFDLSFTGYQDSYKRLGGPVKQDNILVMKVKSSEPLYLKGVIKDYYTGSYWKSTNDSYHMQISDTDISVLKDNEIQGGTIVHNIEHVNITTSTMFNSYIPKKVSFSQNTYYATDELELFSGSLLLKGDKYKIYSVKQSVDWDEIMFSKYVKRENHEKYLQMPTVVPSRVIELAKKITKGKKSDYDRVNALISYLKSNYKYSLNPPETPYNRDFVDYFLFDLKEGYCTYFASSLAVLSRGIGIPSRYVEGFKTPKESNSGVYYVYSSNAHAWVEAYIEGYGWMVFEPTPGYDGILFSADTPEQADEKEKDIIDSDLGNLSKGAKNLKNEMLEELFLEEEAQYKSSLGSQKNGLLKYIVLGMLILFLLIYLKLLYGLVVIRRIIKLEHNLSNRENVLNYYNWILNLFKIQDKGKLDYETVYEYSKRIGNLAKDNVQDFIDVTSIFNKARYGNENITDQEFLKVKNYFLQCEKNIKRKIGILKFIILKYIMMKIYSTKVEG